MPSGSIASGGVHSTPFPISPPPSLHWPNPPQPFRQSTSQVMQASDVKAEGATGKSAQQKLLDELYKKYCIGGGSKSNEQVGVGQGSRGG